MQNPIKRLREGIATRWLMRPGFRISMRKGKNWVVYEEGYVTYGDDKPGNTSERLSHFVYWTEGETFPTSEKQLRKVIRRTIA